MVRAVGMEPVERDSHYNVVEHKSSIDTAVVETPVVEQPVVEQPVETTAEEQVAENKVVEETVDIVEPVVENIETENDMSVKREDANNKDVVVTPRKEPKSKPTTKHKASGEKSGVAKVWNFAVNFYKRLPIISHIIFIGIFCLLFVGLLYFGLMKGTRHNETIAVPNFVGMTIEDARGVAKAKELNIVVRDSIFDVDLPGGTIVDQLPGTSDVRSVTVKPGRKIYVTINAYSRRQVQVPYVAKQTLRQALNQIERSGLTIDELIYEANMTSTDYVERQTINGREIGPTTDRKAAVGTGVTLHVTYQRDNQQTLAPRVVGLSLAKAKASLWDYGLNVGEVIYDESIDDIIERRSARVYKQSAAIGSSMRRGAKVTIYLSADNALVDSMRIMADKDAERAEAARRKELERQKREADSIANLGID